MNDLPLSQWTDEDLLRRRLAGDDGALAILVGRHGDLVRSACSRILGGRAETEDAAQAAFMVLARRADAAIKAPNLTAWLRVVATRCALRLRPRHQGSSDPQPIVVSDPQSALEQAEARIILAEELAQLPDHLRAVFRLCDIDGLAQREAAKRLAIPAGSIARLRTAARERLTIALRRRGIDGAAIFGVLGITSAFETTAASAVTGVTMNGTTLSFLALPILASVAVGGGDVGYTPRNGQPPLAENNVPRADMAFIVMSDGNLWQRIWKDQEKSWTWIFHGRPGQQTMLAPSTVTLMHGDKIFVIDAGGQLWERLHSDRWEWIPHGSPANMRLLSASGDGLDDSKIFLLADNGHCVERWWDGKAWQWADHGAPAAKLGVPAPPVEVEYWYRRGSEPMAPEKDRKP